MYQLTQADVLGLQALPEADSVVTDEVAGMRRSRRGRGDRRTNVCLITLSNVLNRVDILNIFGGGLGL